MGGNIVVILLLAIAVLVRWQFFRERTECPLSVLANILIDVCFLGLAALVMHPVLSEIPSSVMSASWRPVRGKVISSEIREDKDALLRGSPSTKVTYRYRFGSRDYVTERVSFGDSFWPHVPLILDYHNEKLLSEYPVGRAVKVFIDMDNPKDAVLEPGFAPVLLLPALFALCLFALGGYGLFASAMPPPD